MTTMVIVSVSFNGGVPLSVTCTVTVLVLGVFKVNRAGHCYGDRAEQAPVLAVEAGVTGELVSHALEAQ